MATLATLASEALEWFTWDSRGDERYVRLKDGRPDWVQRLVYDAHFDLLPDDWRYECIYGALRHVLDSDCETADDAEDISGDFADEAVDVYTAARYAWLASNLNRGGYVDEAREEYGAESSDVAEQIGMGQYLEASRTYSSVIGSLVAQLDDDDDDDDEGSGISPEGLELGHRYVMGNVNAYCPKCSDEQGVCVLDCDYDLDK